VAIIPFNSITEKETNTESKYDICARTIPFVEKNFKQIRDNGQVPHSNSNVNGSLAKTPT